MLHTMISLICSLIGKLIQTPSSKDSKEWDVSQSKGNLMFLPEKSLEQEKLSSEGPKVHIPDGCIINQYANVIIISWVDPAGFRINYRYSRGLRSAIGYDPIPAISWSKPLNFTIVTHPFGRTEPVSIPRIFPFILETGLIWLCLDPMI